MEKENFSFALDNWKELSLSELEKKLDTSLDEGISKKEARARLEYEKENDRERDTSFFVRKKRPSYDCFLAVVKMLPAILLLFVGVAAFFMGRTQLGVTVISTFISGSIISGILYLGAQRENEELELYSSPSVRVIREGKRFMTDSRNAVMGDVIYLKSGDYVPCDCKIISAYDLLVSEIYLNGDKILKKNVNKCDGGILLAGSFIKGGQVKALCVRSGSFTENSRLLHAGDLAMKNADPKIMREVHGIFYRISALLSLLSLVAAIVGIFTTKDLGILEIFLTYLSYLLSIVMFASPIVGRILCASMQRAAAKPNVGVDFAIIKNNKAMDVLPALTDILLLGRAPLTDGKMHYSSMLCSAKVSNGDFSDLNERVKLLECLYAYMLSEKEHYGDDHAYMSKYYFGIDEMLDNFNFDRKEADMKFKSFYYVEGKIPYACVESGEGDYRCTVVNDSSLLYSCKSFRLGGNICELTEGDILLAENYIKDMESLGEDVLFVMSEINGQNVFEGMVGYCEREALEFIEACELLAKKNVRITVMTCEDSPSELNAISKLGISEFDIIRNDGSNAEIKKDALAYMGYDVESYKELMLQMKKEGRVVAACAIDGKYADIYNEADLFISYDNINYASKNYMLSCTHEENDSQSIRCSQEMRANCSVIVGRTYRGGGGLRGVINAVKTAEFFSFCYLEMMLVSVGVQATLATLTVFGFLFGVSLISYPVMLLLTVGSAFFLVAAYSSFKPRMLKDGMYRKKSVFLKKAKNSVLSPVIATLVYLAFALFLRYNGYISGIAAIPLSTLIAVIFMLLWRFFSSMRRCLGKSLEVSDIKSLAKKKRNSRGLLNVAAITLVISSVARMFLTALIFPSFNIEYGFSGISLGTLMLLAVYIGAFLLCELFSKLLNWVFQK